MAIDNEKVSQDKKNRFGRVVLVVVSLWVVLIGGLVLALQFPWVQTRAVQYLTEWLSEKTGYPVQIGHVAISWLDEIQLDDVQVRDDQDSLMISVDQLLVDFDLVSLLRSPTPSVDGVKLSRPYVQLIKNGPDSGMNINRFIRNIQELLPAKKTKSSKNIPFVIDEVQIKGGRFAYIDPHKDSLRETFDYNHFYLKDINASTADFTILGDTIRTDIGFLTAFSPFYDFTIDTLATDFIYSNTGMLFDKLHLRAGNSTLNDSVVFKYRDQATLEYFQDSVQIYARLRNSILDKQELGVFIPALETYGDTYRINGNLSGHISQFNVSDLDLRFGDNSRLKGFISLDGLPNIMETFIELDLANSYLHPNDLQPYIDDVFYENILRLGNMQFNGQFLGFPNDFVANGTFNTWLGLIRSDINLKLSEETVQSTYSGNLSLSGFQLGRFFERPDLFGTVTGQGSIQGQGLTLETADLRLNANIRNMVIKGYPYKNITTDGHLAQSFFEGKLSVTDPNLRLAGEGSVDLREGQNRIQVNAQLDTAQFHKLGLLKDSLTLSTNVVLDIHGLELDEITGDALLQNLYVNYNGRELVLDSLQVKSRQEEHLRTLSLQTDLVNLDVNGDFAYSQVADNLQRLYTEYMLNFRNREEDIRAYYATKEDPATYEKYNLNFGLLLKDANPLLRLLEPGIYVSENTVVEGRLTGGYTSILSANTTIDTLLWNENRLYDLEAEITSSKVADSTEVLAMAFLSSPSQQFSGISATRDLVTEAIWNEDRIEFTGSLAQAEGDNYAAINADLFFLQNETHIRLRNTETKLLDNIWQVAGDNLVIFRDDVVEVQGLEVFHNDQYIRAEGTLSPAPEDTLLVSVHDVQLANLNPILDQKLHGLVNGDLQLREVLGKPVFKGELKIDSLTVNEFLAGDFLLQADWGSVEERLSVNILGNRQGQQILTAKGYYNPFATDNMLNLEAEFDSAPLNLLEPFFGDMFSQFKGTTSGKVVVLGTPSYPILKGSGLVKDGSLRINYLNTSYNFEGNILFSENEIGFRNLQLFDTDGNPAWLSGGVFHDGFTNFVIDLKARLQATKVLNTTFADNELFYGTAYATGNVEVLGPANNLFISASARSDKGTKIFIPIDFKNEVGSQNYINFVSNKTDSSLVAASSRQKINTTGINLDFDLDITPDAYIEIIFDLRAGDIIRGRGNGKLELDIDTEGDFTMFGSYEIEQGAYNFTLFNVITKEFIIEPGSSIRWDGDPYGGLLDIQASYQQMASVRSVLPADERDKASAQRPYPVELQMDLKGDLMAPDIHFDIAIQDYSAEISNGINGFLSRLETDEQLLNRQVFNLLVLRQFAPIDYGNSFNAASFGSQTAISSISELLANQFTALANQLDENLQIDVNFNLNFDNQFQQDALNTFQLRLSYTFLNGRLRVTRDGSISSSNNINNNNANNVIGDWTVDYLLTPNGQFRVKVFNRANYNSITANYQFSNYTQGVSIFQTKSFDTFKELFQKEKQETPPALPLPDSMPQELILMEEERRQEPAQEN
ncbi:translocation/assembly module TamB domain-containing protein [Cesiribacter sp. SM1]|uniref:translocation/assembly module TamB domain-containing protein n=1 Tax=Cesiribacter sp. SM1 TaxID=2861196 RepID=UPI001CD3B015|nr:translocation/assembly module TamB domain-containing protein [Cesiribacter sp. SM1]